MTPTDILIQRMHAKLYSSVGILIHRDFDGVERCFNTIHEGDLEGVPIIFHRKIRVCLCGESLVQCRYILHYLLIFLHLWILDDIASIEFTFNHINL